MESAGTADLDGNGKLAPLPTEAPSTRPSTTKRSTSTAATRASRATKRAALEESERKFRAVAESASDAIVSADASGDIVFWNGSAERIFGYAEDEVLGRPLTLLMPEFHKRAHVEGLRRRREADAPRVIGRAIEIRGLRKDGSAFPIELSLSTWTTREGRFYTGILRDISLRKENEQKLAALAAERAAEAGRERFHRIADRAPAMLWMCDGEGRPAFYNASCLAFTGHTLEQALGGAWVEAVHAGDRDDCLETFRSSFNARRPFSMEYRLRRADGEHRWVLDTGVPRYDAAGEFEGYIGSSLDITDRKEREREQEALLAMARALRAAGSRLEMVPIVLDQVASLLQADGAALLLRDRPSDEVRVELGRGVWTSFTGVRVPEDASLTQRVIEVNGPYLSNDVAGDPELAAHPAMNGLTAVASVPLIDRDIVGALWVGRRATINREDLRLLSAIGEMTANAMRRAGLHEETARRLRQITALQAAQAAMSASLDLTLTLDLLIEQLTTVLEVDAAAVLLLDPDTRRLEYAVGRGFRSRITAHPNLRLGQCQAGQAALERRTRHIPDLGAVRNDLLRKWLVDEEEFVSYYAVPLVSRSCVKGVLELFDREARTPNADWMGFVRTLASQASVAIDHATLFDQIRRGNDELRLAYDITLEGWSRALDLRDKETEGHTQRVAEMTERLTREIGMSEEDVQHARRGALLHDIGKMGIPDSILHKPGPLDEEEWRVMRLHPVYAFELLSPIPFLRPALDIPHAHHERWDGTGYPRGLKGEEIPVAARVFAVVDVWDALRSDRPYRPAWPAERALHYLRSETGSHFDSRMVDLFLDVGARS
jgi:PAS domain S-box-containing protein/putative nucleotidyltransferase with HDIG domain